MSVYGTSPVKRTRRTEAEAEALDAALVEIVEQFRPVTVRQAFYQAVNRGLVPKSETKGYRIVQRRLVALRGSGEVPYGFIVDGTRYVHGHRRYYDLDEFTTYAAGLYRKDYWATAEVNVEVWLEKDALKGVLVPTVVNECGLGLHVTRGFASITYLQEAAEQIEADSRPTYVYVLTDFDPSGISIAEKVEEELTERAVLRYHGGAAGREPRTDRALEPAHAPDQDHRHQGAQVPANPRHGLGRTRRHPAR